MATLVLQTAGAAAGALFGPVGAAVGRALGGLAGAVVDRALIPGARTDGPRLASLDVQTSTEGAAVPRVYGRARIPGQVIWATRFEEETREEGGGGKGRGGTQRSYRYFANFAVGLCEGPVHRIGRVWADGKPLDLSGITMRRHLGKEDQEPDPLIEAKQGDAPAYRGLAYVVFERLPLDPYGNRLPQLSFEVIRCVDALEGMVRAVTLIPGATEFGYATDLVTRDGAPGGDGVGQPPRRHRGDRLRGGGGRTLRPLPGAGKGGAGGRLVRRRPARRPLPAAAEDRGRRPPHQGGGRGRSTACSGARRPRRAASTGGRRSAARRRTTASSRRSARSRRAG
jgi:hypothetical protein